MAFISEIKAQVISMLAEAYAGDEPAKESSPTELETEGFMRVKDAKAISTACGKHKYYVSFRAAGPDTIQRIEEGHPCKGHDITDKSIKIKDGEWTYLAPENINLGKDANSVLNALKGFVGCSYVPRHKDGTVFYESPYKTPKILRHNPDGTIDAIFYLEEVYTLPEDTKGKTQSTCSYSKLHAETLSIAQLEKAYTGDYDIHDIITKNGRPPATTIDELDVLELLNAELMRADNQRKKLAEPKPKYYHQSPYALIRHGAQTSYFDFLITKEGEKELRKEFTKLLAEKAETEAKGEKFVFTMPFGKSVVKIDDKIAMFDPTGKMYILRGVPQIYKFYTQKDLLKHIPFYNFFDVLYQMPAYRPRIACFAKYIDELFMYNMGLIKTREPYQLMVKE